MHVNVHRTHRTIQYSIKTREKRLATNRSTRKGIQRKPQNYDQKKGHKNSLILIRVHPFCAAHLLDWNYMGNEAI